MLTKHASIVVLLSCSFVYPLILAVLENLLIASLESVCSGKKLSERVSVSASLSVSRTSSGHAYSCAASDSAWQPAGTGQTNSCASASY